MRSETVSYRHGKHDELLAWLQLHVAGKIEGDLIDLAPDISFEQSYALQFALMAWLEGEGDRLIGYKAAFTNPAMQKRYGVSGPTIGTLMRSGWIDANCPHPIVAENNNSAEPEIAVLLKRDLVGPRVSASDVLAAVEGYLPALEIASSPPKTRSREMSIAVSKLAPGIVIGPRVTSPSAFDLRLEGAIVSVDSRAKGSGTAVEVLGNPLNVVAFIANSLANYGRCIRAGMIVMTGSVVDAVPVAPGSSVLAEFSRIGSVGLRLTN